MFLSPFVAYKAVSLLLFTQCPMIIANCYVNGQIPSIWNHLSGMITNAFSQKRPGRLLMSCKILCLIDRLLLESFNIAAIPSLIITQCCDPILGGRGGTISILKGKSWNYREHAILLSRKRINKGIKRMNSLPLFLVAFSYET